MPSPYNITNIPAPRVDFIDSRTGLMAREWYRFFFNLFNLTGAGTTDTSLADLQMGPPAINAVLGELGITYDQAQLATMMAEYEQATRDIQNRLDTAPASPQLGTLAAVNEDNVRLIGFSTNPSPAVPVPAPTGTLYWDGNSTLGLQMNQGVLAKIGQSQFTYVKASAAITKGQLCKHTGSVGSSGVITAAPTSIGMTDPNQIVGVAAEDIALNAFGFIQDSGDLRGFDTTGSSVGEVWADGDSLYYNPAYVGALTKVKPSAPNIKSYIGEVINAGSGGSGSIHIRMSPGSVLGGTDSNVQFGTLVDKDLIQYDGALQYWKNVPASSIAIGTATNLAGGAAGSLPYQSGAGATTFLPIGTATQVLKVNAGATAPEWVSGAALSKVDDTNVTLTLGGSPTTALLAATSLTLGWTGTLAVSRGGTGTGTAFTAGSVIFAGVSGVYSQDNANLFWDDTNDRLGLGTAAPSYILSLSGNAARTIGMERHTTANTAGNNLTVLAGGATSGATDKNGGNLVLSSGTATGTGSSNVTFLTAAAGAAGTTDRSPAERARIDGSGRFLLGQTGAGLQNSNSAALAPTAGSQFTLNKVTGSGSGNAYIVFGLSAVLIGSIKQNGTTGIALNSASQLVFESGGANERMRIDSSGNVLVTGPGGLGYGTGSGGSVTQATSRTTGVTLNKTNGAITLVSAAGTTTWQTFTVTNSTVVETDVVKVCQKSGTDKYMIHVTAVTAGSFDVTFATTGGTTTEQPVFNFAVIKAVTA